MESTVKFCDSLKKSPKSISRRSQNHLDVDRLGVKYSPEWRKPTSPIEASTPLNLEHCTAGCCQHKIDVTPIIWKTPSGDRTISRTVQLSAEDDYEDSYRTATQSSIKFNAEINQNVHPLNKNYDNTEDLRKKGLDRTLACTFKKYVPEKLKEETGKSIVASKKLARHQSFPSKIPVRVAPRKPLADKPIPNPNIILSSARPRLFAAKPRGFKTSCRHTMSSKVRNTDEAEKVRIRKTTPSIKAPRVFESTPSQTNQKQYEKRQNPKIAKTKYNEVKRLGANKKRLTEPMSPKLLTAARAALKQKMQNQDSYSAVITRSLTSSLRRKSRVELLKEAYKDLATMNFGMTMKVSKINTI